MKTQEENKIEDVEVIQESDRGMTLITKYNSKDYPLGLYLVASVLLHFIGILMCLILIFCLHFFNIKLQLFPVKKPVIKDIEFVIENKRPKKVIAKVQAKQNSVAPKKVEKTEVKKSVPKKVKQPIMKKVTPVVTKKTMPKFPRLIKSKPVKPQVTIKPVKPASKNDDIPDFSMPMPKLKSISSGLGTPTKTKSRASGIDTSTAPSIKEAESSFASSSSSSTSSGSNKITAKKLVTTYDISPYVAELKRNIKMNWKHSAGSKRVELFVRIAKDGRVIILNVKKTSEIADVDNAALSAVRKCQPLNPLPSKYTKSYLDVVFVFDVNNISSRY